MKNKNWESMTYYLPVKVIFGILFIFASLNFVSAFLISDLGADVKEISTGNLLDLGNLTVLVYDSQTEGNLVYNSTFSSAILNGSWNIVINPDLQYGKNYWKDYMINNEDLDFDGSERLEFQSSIGKINNISFINFSLISSCSTGSSIRLIYENGSVICETDDSGSTEANLTNYALKNQSEIFAGNITTSQTGFFGFLGSLSSRITKLWVGEINATGNIETLGNATAGYFKGDGSLLTNLPAGDANNSWNQSFAGTLYAGIAWGYNQTSPANSYADSIASANNASWMSTYNSTYASNLANNSWNQSFAGTLYAGIAWGYNQTSPAVSDIDSRFWNKTQTWNATQLYNKSEINVFNSSWSSNYNSTYNNLLNQQCPAGQVVNGTLSNGTIVCASPPAGTESDPVWSGNLTSGVSADLNPLTTVVQSLGSTSKRWLKGWFQDLDISNNITVGGNVSAKYYIGSLNSSTFPTSSCSGTDKATGIYSNGTFSCGTDQSGGGATIKTQRADVITTNHTIWNTTNLNLAVTSGKNYTLICDLLFTGAAATTGQAVNLSSTASSVNVTISYDTWSSATAKVGFSATAFGTTALIGTGSGAAIVQQNSLIADFRTTGSGTVSLGIRSEIGGSASTLKTGSMCQLFDVTNSA